MARSGADMAAKDVAFAGLLGTANSILRAIALGGRKHNPAATIDRLFVSQHVKDLRVIVGLAFYALLLVLICAGLLTYEDYRSKPLKVTATPAQSAVESTQGQAGTPFDSSATQSPAEKAVSIKQNQTSIDEDKAAAWALWKDSFWHVTKALAESFITYFGPVLAVFAAVVAWAYQTGSARLGVVDLFACEISTLCRVVTVVDAVSRIEKQFKRADAIAHSDSAATVDTTEHEPPTKFASGEDYFPVFASNARDLQSLEARVVINITAFYTFMKAMRDSMRNMSEIGAPTKATAGAVCEAARNMIYMLYLGLESARRAIGDLVEFEPEQAERTVVVLISELKAYAFLRKRYTDKHDSHFLRLTLREDEYRDLVPSLHAMIDEGKKKEDEGKGTARKNHWQPAWLLLDQLDECYEKAKAAAAP
jgi:hypothetical protein